MVNEELNYHKVKWLSEWPNLPRWRGIKGVETRIHHPTPASREDTN